MYGHDTQVYNILAVLQFGNLKPDFGKKRFSPSQAVQPKTESKGEGPGGACSIQAGLAKPACPQDEAVGVRLSWRAGWTGLLKDH